MKTSLLLLISSTFLASVLFAHDLYLMPAKFKVEPGDKVVISVHNGDSFPTSEGPTDPKRLLEARMSDGTPLEQLMTLGRATHGLAEIKTKGSIYAYLHTEPKLLELGPEKFESYLKEEGLDHAIAYRAQHGESAKGGREMYSKYAKTLLTSNAPDAGFSKVLGLTIEIIPEVNPALLKPGDQLPIQVLFRGKPAAGLQVIKAWAVGATGQHATAGRTDEQGRIRIPIESAAKWRIHTVAIERHPDAAQADWQSFWASLTFESSSPSGTTRLQ